MLSSARVKALAQAAGFELAGVARAQAPETLRFFREWLGRGYAGELAYLTSQADRRADVRAAFPWARSVVVVGAPYDTPHPYSPDAPVDRGWISRYAWGDDYHGVLETRLLDLAAKLRQSLHAGQVKTYVDTGPVAEKAYAAAAGLGAYGKNTCLLHPTYGSWFFLGVAITDLELEPDAPRADMCGSCTACLEACPTQAFPEPYVLDATRCISYLTIEKKGAIPEPLRAPLGRHVFGCDICQDVCPWNRKRHESGEAAFEPRAGALAPRLEQLAGLDQKGFSERFRSSPVKRAKRRGLLRNVAVALGNTGDASNACVLETLARDEDALVREHAVWALERLRHRRPSPE